VLTDRQTDRKTHKQSLTIENNTTVMVPVVNNTSLKTREFKRQATAFPSSLDPLVPEYALLLANNALLCRFSFALCCAGDVSYPGKAE